MERSDTYLRGNAGPPDVAAPEAGRTAWNCQAIADM